jgi:hypothetical protein
MPLRFIYFALFFGLLFALPACDSADPDDPDPIGNGGGGDDGDDDDDDSTEYEPCAVPDLGAVSAGSFVIELKENDARYARTGPAVHGVVEDFGDPYFAFVFETAERESAGIWTAGTDPIAPGTYEVELFEGIQGGTENSEGNGSAGMPGTFTLAARGGDGFEGTFALLSTVEFNGVRSSVCGAFKSVASDDIENSDLPGVFP